MTMIPLQDLRQTGSLLSFGKYNDHLRREGFQFEQFVMIIKNLKKFMRFDSSVGPKLFKGLDLNHQSH